MSGIILSFVASGAATPVVVVVDSSFSGAPIMAAGFGG